VVLPPDSQEQDGFLAVLITRSTDMSTAALLMPEQPTKSMAPATLRLLCVCAYIVCVFTTVCVFTCGGIHRNQHIAAVYY
jgi:hypothetical protein